MKHFKLCLIYFKTEIFGKINRTLSVLIFAYSNFRKFNLKKFGCFVNTNFPEWLRFFIS